MNAEVHIAMLSASDPDPNSHAFGDAKIAAILIRRPGSPRDHSS
jgi:hypothetical protein